MKTATNIYIFNLALADALVTTTMPFQSTDYLLNTWPFGEVVCKVFISIDYYNMFTSIFTLTMMSVDRYVAVCHPVKALDFRTPIKAKMINVCIWILSSAAGIPAFVLGGTQTNSGEKQFSLSLIKVLKLKVQFVGYLNKDSYSTQTNRGQHITSKIEGTSPMVRNKTMLHFLT